MKSLDDLITFYTNRQSQYLAEIDRALSFKDEMLSKRAFKLWTEEYKTARDTVSYLETLRRRQSVGNV